MKKENKVNTQNTAAIEPKGGFRGFLKKIDNEFSRFDSYIENHNGAYLAWAFLMPAVIMFLIYAAMKVFPFGESSVLVLDLNAQYVQFFEGLRDWVWGDASLLYSFSRQLGGEFMGIYAYYVASPFSYIVALFPKDMITEALYVMFVLKCGLCGLSFGYYMHKNHYLGSTGTIIFSTLYALTGYVVVMQHNTMWMDNVILLPLLALGVESLVKYKKFSMFTLALALSLLSNFYIGYMSCIFVAVYFFYYYIAQSTDGANNPLGETKHFAKSLLRVIIFSVIAIAISAIIVLTAYYSLSFGKNEFTEPDFSFKLKFDFLDFIVKLLPFSFDTVRPEGLPFVYCGVITLILVPLYFLTAKVTRREKLASAALILFFFLSMIISPVDMVWHGFQAPNWLNYRYSYMFCFVMLVLAAKAFTRLREFGSKPIIIVSVFWGIFYIAIQKFASIVETIADNLGMETFDEKIDSMLISLDNMAGATAVWTTVGAIVLYCVLLIYCTQEKKNSPKYERLTMILVCIICLESFLNGVGLTQALHRDVVISTRNSYYGFMNAYQPAIDYIQESDDGFYRMEKVDIRTVNDPFTLGYRGLSSSSSTLNDDTVRFLDKLGLSSSSHWSEYRGSTPVTDALLGIRYLMMTDSEISLKTKDNVESFKDIYEKIYSETITDPDIIENYFGDQSEVADADKVTSMITEAYFNKYALPIALMANSDILSLSFEKPADFQYYHDDVKNIDYSNYDDRTDVEILYSPFERMNSMINALLGTSSEYDVFVGINSSISKENVISTEKVQGHTLYEPTGDGVANSAGMNFTFTVPSNLTEETTIYAYFPSEYPRESTLLLNGEEFSGFFSNDSSCIIDVGNFAPGEQVSVTLQLRPSPEFYLKENEFYFYYVDETAYASAFEALAQSTFNITEFTERSFAGTVNVTADRNTFFTTIPYDEGWKVTVDGKPVEFKEALGSLIAFEIDGAGEHTVTLEYMPSCFVNGVIITVIGSLILLAFMIVSSLILRGKIKINRKSSLAAVAETILPLPGEAEVTTSPLTEDDNEEEIEEEADVPAETQPEPAAPAKKKSGKKSK